MPAAYNTAITLHRLVHIGHQPRQCHQGKRRLEGKTLVVPSEEAAVYVGRVTTYIQMADMRINSSFGCTAEAFSYHTGVDGPHKGLSV